MKGRETKLRVPGFVSRIMAGFDTHTASFSDFEVAGQLDENVRKHKNLSPEERKGCWAELNGFSFQHSDPRHANVWATHFGPLMTGETRDGKPAYLPDLAGVDADILDYWDVRSQSATNPILRARYSDLVWDLTKPVSGKKPNIEFARRAIDSYLIASRLPIAKGGLDHARRLERGLEIAISINDRTRLEAIRDAMVELFHKMISLGDSRCWGFLFDNLYENKKVVLGEKQLSDMIRGYEKLLSRYANMEEKAGFDPFSAKDVALRLAQHYQRVGRQEEVKRVIRVYGGAFIAMAGIADALLGMTWLQDVYQDYIKFGMKDEAEQLTLMIKDRGAAADGELKPISGSIEVRKDKLDAVVEYLTSEDLDKACRQIAGYFLPRESEAKEALARIQKESPLIASIGVRQLGEQQIIAEAGSIEDDLEGRVVMALSEQIGFDTPFLAATVDKLRERYLSNADDLVSSFYRSPVFDEDRRDLVVQGIQAYMQGDHTKAIHVLVPQIEHLLRRQLAQLDRPTSKHIRSNLSVMQEKSLDDILGDAVMRKALGDDVWRYLSAFLGDRRGHNLRNRVAHGLVAPQEFNRGLSDRVLHVLMLIAAVSEQKEDANSSK